MKDITEIIREFDEAYGSSEYKDDIASVLEVMNYICTQQKIYPMLQPIYYDKVLNECMTSIFNSLAEESEFTWPYYIAPYFVPQEIAQLQGYYYCEMVGAEDGTDSTSSWDKKVSRLEDELRNTEDPDEIARIKRQMGELSYDPETQDFYGYAESFNPTEFSSKVKELELKIEQSSGEQADIYRQEMVNLGWNPEIPFTEGNICRAKKRIETIYQEKYADTFINLQPMISSFNESSDEVVHEASKSSSKPIHIVLIKGDGFLSNTITKFTNGDFSHSAICIDNDFDKLYSFNLFNDFKKRGGFSFEKVSEYPDNGRLAVFTFFVNNNTYAEIKKKIDILANRVNKTAYSVANILTFPFKHIKLNMPDAMICSQFVDSMLKMAKLDITGKDSSKVSPNYLYSSSSGNNSIYKVFDGLKKDFNKSKIEKYINNMSRKVAPIAEASIYEQTAMMFVYPVVLEARQFPIQFNKSGDLLLRNPFVDFDAEYSASHKLLVEYEKTKNYEAMKYELARLYYMNYVLEKKLYHNSQLKNKDKNIKTRARILNDFKKYIRIVVTNDPGFNFAKYYEESVFYPHTIEIKSSTLLKLKDIISCIL